MTFYSLNAHQLIANLACRVVLVRLSGAVVALKQDGCYNWANGVRGGGVLSLKVSFYTRVD